MFKFIYKDLALQKSTIRFMLVFLVVVLVIMNTMDSDGKYLVFATSVVYCLTITGFAYDEKAKGEYIINSMPVTRDEVVLSKYFSMLIYTVWVVIFIGLLGYLINILGLNIGLRMMNLKVIRNILIANVLICSINFPVIFKFGYRKGKIVGTLTYIVLFSCTAAAFDVSSKDSPSILMTLGTGSAAVNVLIFVTLAAIALISLITSMKVYETKDL